MLNSAHILQFPARSKSAGLTPAEAREVAQSYLGQPLEQRPDVLSDADVLAALCTVLREMWETAPATVASEAAELYLSIASDECALGLFDERDYFLGETALIAGTAYRFIGKLDEAERWLDRAESGFRHTINPAPLLANLSYARLTLRYMVGRHQDLLELLPSLVSSFRKLGMDLEADKCRFLEVKALMQLGRTEECLRVLASLRESQPVRGNRTLLGHVLVHTGNCLGSMAQYEDASRMYAEALPIVQGNGPSSGLAQLKFSIGDTYRAQNHLAKALEAYRAAQSDFADIQMTTFVAQLHLVIAETLLSLGRHREAEWEILSALPTIDEQKMVPEGFAAVALLRDSVRLRKTDPNALRELREHLQAGQ